MLTAHSYVHAVNFLMSPRYFQTHEFKVIKLYEGNEYKFRVCAENKVGSSEPCETKELVKCKLPYGKTNT